MSGRPETARRGAARREKTAHTTEKTKQCECECCALPDSATQLQWNAAPNCERECDCDCERESTAPTRPNADAARFSSPLIGFADLNSTSGECFAVITTRRENACALPFISSPLFSRSLSVSLNSQAIRSQAAAPREPSRLTTG